MNLQEFEDHYWMKADLIDFARDLGLATHGYKPELKERIRRHLCGEDPVEAPPRPSRNAPRDSDRPLTRQTPVVNYKSDKKTRAFFKAEIGPEFHFTFHVNQYRLNNAGLTYGDLIDEWLAERERRRRKGYKAKIPAQTEYNQFVRDFLADEANKGKGMKEAAKAWNKVKPTRNRRYSPAKAGKRTSAERDP